MPFPTMSGLHQGPHCPLNEGYARALLQVAEESDALVGDRGTEGDDHIA